MKNPLQESTGAQVAVGALALLGFIGGCLTVAHSGLETSPRRGGTPVFVPFPQAWFFVVAMLAMSLLALFALLQARGASRTAFAAVTLAYASAVLGVIWIWGP